MRVAVNGEPREVEEGSTVSDLLASLGIRPEGVAVELNREIVPKSRHGSHRLAEGDRLEIVTMVGGG